MARRWAAPVCCALLACPPAGTSTPPPLCSLPGVVRFTDAGVEVLDGGRPGHDLGFLRLPAGFCARWYANVGNARNLRFAPGGDLFVASPRNHTTSGGPDGGAAIVVLFDDDHDGEADPPATYLGDLPQTVGLLFSGGWLYYQDGTRIRRRPFRPLDREPSGLAEVVANVDGFADDLHWPKTLDQADDGTLYVGSAGDGVACLPDHPFKGGILALDGSPAGTPVAKGLRNPIAVRCASGHDRCFALELVTDFTQDRGGREKLVPIRAGDDWGFPCCATRDLPYTPDAGVDCSTVAPEADGFVVGDTPFSLDFERGGWPSPWGRSAFVVLHGAGAAWVGARVVAIDMDPATGLPLPATDRDGGSSGAMRDFATGWDDGRLDHGRPAVLAFGPDGRLYVANDATGDLLWIAPLAPEPAR